MPGDIEAIVDENISPEDMKRFETQYNEQLKRGHPSATVIFTYAHCLVKSKPSDTKLGVKLLHDLLRRDEEEITKRDCIFYLAIAHTRLKNYDDALKFVDLLLDAEPDNLQGKDLKEVINKRMRTDAMVGAAIIGGGALVVGAVAAAGIAVVSSIVRSARR